MEGFPTPQTLKAVNDLVVQAAVALGLEDGVKLRVDTTVVETDIHHPTDNTLLWDVVRVVTRLIGRLAKALDMRRESPLEWGDGMKCNPGRLFRCNPVNGPRRQWPVAGIGIFRRVDDWRAARYQSRPGVDLCP
jgi:hypothetical protein